MYGGVGSRLVTDGGSTGRRSHQKKIHARGVRRQVLQRPMAAFTSVTAAVTGKHQIWSTDQEGNYVSSPLEPRPCPILSTASQRSLCISEFSNSWWTLALSHASIQRITKTWPTGQITSASVLEFTYSASLLYLVLRHSPFMLCCLLAFFLHAIFVFREWLIMAFQHVCSSRSRRIFCWETRHSRLSFSCREIRHSRLSFLKRKCIFCGIVGFVPSLLFFGRAAVS